MKTLISIISAEEAMIANQSGAEIIDIKNPDEGSMGAQFPWIIKDIISKLGAERPLISTTIGDLEFKPAGAGLAAYGMALLNPNYIKAGLYGVSNYNEALVMGKSIVKSVKMGNPNIPVALSGYADYSKFGGIDEISMVKAACNSGADYVMLDTAIKDGNTLFDNMGMNQLYNFIGMAKEAGLKVALAGSLKLKDFDKLSRLNPDIVGVRGAICRKGIRNGIIDKKRLTEFLSEFRMKERSLV
jgi:(5-formylfuran-3-yl)methyl phosphate synthase